MLPRLRLLAPWLRVLLGVPRLRLPRLQVLFPSAPGALFRMGGSSRSAAEDPRLRLQVLFPSAAGVSRLRLLLLVRVSTPGSAAGVLLLLPRLRLLVLLR